MSFLITFSTFSINYSKKIFKMIKNMMTDVDQLWSVFYSNGCAQAFQIQVAIFKII